MTAQVNPNQSPSSPVPDRGGEWKCIERPKDCFDYEWADLVDGSGNLIVSTSKEVAEKCKDAHNATLEKAEQQGGSRSVKGQNELLPCPHEGQGAIKCDLCAARATRRSDTFLYCDEHAPKRSEPLDHPFGPLHLAHEIIADIVSALRWLDGFVEEPETFPGDGDRQWWRGRREQIRGFATKLHLSLKAPKSDSGSEFSQNVPAQEDKDLGEKEA